MVVFDVKMVCVSEVTLFVQSGGMSVCDFLKSRFRMSPLSDDYL